MMEAIQEFRQEDRVYQKIPMMDVSEDGQMVSESVYWEKYYLDSFYSYEWNNGRLEERPMTNPESYDMYFWFTELLSHFLKANPIGRIMGLEFGFRLVIPGKTTIRKPDLGLILHNNPIQPHRHDSTYKGVFDLCIESLSHSSKKEILRDTVDKKSEYENMGIGEYYILDSRREETTFYRLGKQGVYDHIKPVKGVICSGMLPGFRFRVSDLYSCPSLLEMAEDKVYKDFILPFYTKEKQRANQETQKVEQEKQRAEQESRRADQEKRRADQEARRADQEERRAGRMMAKLKSMGLSEKEIKSLSES